jgi:hypothetical protein
MLILVRDRSGDLVEVPDPDLPVAAPRAVHHPSCDGRGRVRADDPADALPLLCPACRGEAVAARARADERARIGRGPRVARPQMVRR